MENGQPRELTESRPALPPLNLTVYMRNGQVIELAGVLDAQFQDVAGPIVVYDLADGGTFSLDVREVAAYALSRRAPAIMRLMTNGTSRQ